MGQMRIIADIKKMGVRVETTPKSLLNFEVKEKEAKATHRAPIAKFFLRVASTAAKEKKRNTDSEYTAFK